MKSCINTQIILIFLTLFASTNALGKWGVHPTCGDNASFLYNEFNLVHASAVSMQADLNTPDQTTNTFVRWMFGTEQTNYVPISFPKAAFGGDEDIFGLANIAGPIAYTSLGTGDVVSAPLSMGDPQQITRQKG